MVDEEQQYLTDLAHRRAMKLMTDNRTLRENEVLEPDDIELLVGRYMGRPASPNRDPIVKDLEPGPAEIAAAEADPQAE